MKWIKIRFFFAFVVCSCITQNIYATDGVLQEHKPAIVRAFRTAFNAPLPNSFEKLPGGFSSPGIYKTVIQGKPYVLRLSHPKRSVQDKQRTMSCMTISAERGLAPKVCYTNAADSIVIMDYIKAKQLSPEHLRDKELLTKLAKIIRALHEGPQFPEFIPIMQVRRSFERMLGEYKPEILAILSNSLESVENKLEDNKLIGPCHNDLKPENILYDGDRFWLVDWEAASQGDCFFDLVTICTLFAMTSEQKSIFLEAYFGEKLTSTSQLQLNLMKIAVLSYYGTAYIMVAKNQTTALDFPDDISLLPSLESLLMAQLQEPALPKSPQQIQSLGISLITEAVKIIQQIQDNQY